MKFSIMGFFGKCDQIRSSLRIWSHLLKKPLMENFIFCAVDVAFFQKNMVTFDCILSKSFKVSTLTIAFVTSRVKISTQTHNFLQICCPYVYDDVVDN